MLFVNLYVNCVLSLEVLERWVYFSVGFGIGLCFLSILMVLFLLFLWISVSCPLVIVLSGVTYSVRAEVGGFPVFMFLFLVLRLVGVVVFLYFLVDLFSLLKDGVDERLLALTWGFKCLSYFRSYYFLFLFSL